MMKLKSLIQYLQDKLDEHRANAQYPQACNLNSSEGRNEYQRNTYFINLEENYSFRKMQAVIDELKSKNKGDVEVTADHAKIITDFFDARWSRIKSTDAIYSIKVLNSVNLMCREVANYLSKQLRKLVGGKNENMLLMNTILVWRNPGHESADLSTVSPHRFLPTDDNKYLIEILHTPESSLNGELLLRFREHGSDQGREKYRYLTARADRRDSGEYEFDRVFGHSVAVKEYYEKVLPLLRNPEANKKTIDTMKIHLRNALMRDDYIKNMDTVRASYGGRGEDLLKSNLLENAADLFADREQLFDYMGGKLDASEWEDFIKYIREKMGDAEFMKFMRTETIHNKDDSITKVVKPIKETVITKSMYKNHYEYDLAVNYCQSVLYWMDRAPKGKTTSFFGGDPVDVIEKCIKAHQRAITAKCHGGDMHAYIDAQGDIADAMRRKTRGYMTANLTEIIERKKVDNKAGNRLAR